MALFEIIKRKISSDALFCSLDSEIGLDELKDDEIEPLKVLLKNNKWQVLELIDFMEAHDQAIAILTSLICHVTKRFTLTGTSLGDATALAAAASLKENPQLRTLIVGGFEVTETGLLALGEAISNHRNINEFSIICSATISDQAIIQFVMQVANNVSWTSCNMNGIIFSPRKKDQSLIHFINEVILPKIITRNKEFASIPSLAERHRLYNMQIEKFNRDIAANFDALMASHHLKDSGVKKEDLQINTKKTFPTLVNTVLFWVDQNRSKLVQQLKTTTLPTEIDNELGYEPTLAPKKS